MNNSYLNENRYDDSFKNISYNEPVELNANMLNQEHSNPSFGSLTFGKNNGQILKIKPEFKSNIDNTNANTQPIINEN